MTQLPPEQMFEPLQAQRPSFVFPKASVTIQAEDEPMTIDEVLAIVFQISASNPGCKVGFWLKILPDE